MSTRKKKKEPPDYSRSVLLLQSVNFTGLFPSGFNRSGIFTPVSALDCPIWCSYAIFWKLQWLLRTSGVSVVKPSPTFVDGSIAHFESGTVALGSSSGAVRVEDAVKFRHGIQMRLRRWAGVGLCPSIGKPPAWKRGSYFSIDPLVTHGNPHSVSPIFLLRGLQIRTPGMVSNSILFPLRAVCCQGVYLIESCLKPAMKQIESRLNSIILCVALKMVMDVIASCKVFRDRLIGLYFWPPHVSCPCIGVVSWLILFVTLKSVRCFGWFWHFTILVPAALSIVKSWVAGLGRWVSFPVNCSLPINLLELLVKVVWPFCFRLSLGSNFGSVQGSTVPLKCWFYLTSTHHVKPTCDLGVSYSTLGYPLQFLFCDGCTLFLDGLAALSCLIVWLSWILLMVVVPAYPWLVWAWSWLSCHIWTAYNLRYKNHLFRSWSGDWLTHSRIALLLALCDVGCITCLIQRYFAFYLGVLMAREPPYCYGFEAFSHHGKLFLISVMKPWVLHSEFGVDLGLYWVLPSVLLSLCLVSLYAQNHVLAYSCWHLHFSQTTRDEVKGLYPVADEDVNTEANLMLSLLLCRPCVFALFLFCFWPLILLHILWQEIQDLLAQPFCDVSTPILRLEYRVKGVVAQLRMMQTTSFGLQIVNLYLFMLVQCFDIQNWCNVAVEWSFECIQIAEDVNVNWSHKCIFGWKRPCICYWSIPHPFLWIVLLGMYCLHMTVMDHIPCITDDTVSGPSRCISFVVVNCNRCWESIIEQHLRVLGPCLMALVLHLRMLGHAFARFYYSYYVDDLGWNDLVSLSKV